MVWGKAVAWKGGGGLFQSKGAIYLKEQPVSLRPELTSGRISVTKEEEGVERGGCRVIRVRRKEGWESWSVCR
jgi:hypothetical protein